MTLYFSKGERDLPRPLSTISDERGESGSSQASAERINDDHPADSPGSVRGATLSDGEDQLLAAVPELPPLIDDSESIPPESALQEESYISNSQPLAGDTNTDNDIAYASISSGENPEPIDAEFPAEKMSEQTFLINFSFDSDDLIPDSHHVLNSAVMMLKANPDSVAAITGFTDNQGDKQYNLALSRKRAVAVQQYLVGAGIAPERLVVEGRGVLTDPVEEGEADSEDSMEPYRIVQIKITADRLL
ncbi:MAG: OmpA family protein [Halioglobus sp.]